MAVNVNHPDFQTDLLNVKNRNATVAQGIARKLTLLNALPTVDVLKNTRLYELKEHAYDSSYDVGTLNFKVGSISVRIQVIVHSNTIYCSSILKP